MEMSSSSVNLLLVLIAAMVIVGLVVRWYGPLVKDLWDLHKHRRNVLLEKQAARRQKVIGKQLANVVSSRVSRSSYRIRCKNNYGSCYSITLRKVGLFPGTLGIQLLRVVVIERVGAENCHIRLEEGEYDPVKHFGTSENDIWRVIRLIEDRLDAITQNDNSRVTA